MTGRKLFTLYVILFMAATLSSCFNLFSLLAPTDPAEVDDVTRLMAIGDQALYDLNYDIAYDAFSKVVTIQPTNSVAIEKMCTAYLFMQIPITNVIATIISGDYSRLGLNHAYQAGSFLSEHLYKIVNDQADGVIPYDDFSVNLNFFVFNTLYAAFFIADTDNDQDIQTDTNDYFIISNDLTFAANLPNLTNDFIKSIQIINAMYDKVNSFMVLVDRSDQSLSLLSNSIHSSEGIALLTNVEAQIESIRLMIETNFSDVSNLTALSQFNLTNVSDITNLIYQSGLTNYSDFTNQMYGAGITNLEDLQSQVTNIFPDLTNLNSLISNLYGL